MSQTNDPGQPGTPPHDPVGSVGDEAAKLFGALSDWAKEQEHVAAGGEECRYCPVCQVIHVVRQTSPEVRAHLSAAASSLVQAAAGLLTTTPPPREPVEKIDLDEPEQPEDPRR